MLPHLFYIIWYFIFLLCPFFVFCLFFPLFYWFHLLYLDQLLYVLRFVLFCSVCFGNCSSVTCCNMLFCVELCFFFYPSENIIKNLNCSKTQQKTLQTHLHCFYPLHPFLPLPPLSAALTLSDSSSLFLFIALDPERVLQFHLISHQAVQDCN